MPNFRPSIIYTTKESLSEYRNDYSNTKQSYIYKSFDTYEKLKKELKQIIKDSIDNTVSVSRSRRGEWGEWFEVWGLQNGKAVIQKQGWQ